ncbi:MAG TPA: D-glycero-beta-D-manno-heptose 1,7-bisphosphate 7-phosphatase [Steroidobacteraceae bacterium]|nr:D-glycero-beta-D-manno-heptose 1,7-bisphosphate 7-phosphatase [Steroidobacteraceae bacterium]
MTYKHVILDRDGVLNREADDGGYVLDPSQFIWIPGALEALEMLRRAGVYLSVATNQSGVGRGLMTLAQLEAVHDRMRSEALRGGGALDTIVFCPHTPEDGCGCRKPAPGLIQEALRLSGIPAAESLVVGDAQRDLEAAARAGVPAALVRTGKGRETERLLRGATVPTYDDLPQLARAILRVDEHRMT